MPEDAIQQQPTKRFVLFMRGNSPIVPDNGVCHLQVNCPKCRQQLKLGYSQGGAIINNPAMLRELFERVGTQVSIDTKDVLAGARIKEIGDLAMDWCRDAEVGDMRDLIEISCTMIRVRDDIDTVQRIQRRAETPAAKLQLVGTC